MLTSANKLSMQADVIAIIDDDPANLVFRRGDTTLASQKVRIALTGVYAQRINTRGMQESTAVVIVLGTLTLNIQPGDRFTHLGAVYEVRLVEPNRLAGIMAEALAVE